MTDRTSSRTRRRKSRLKRRLHRVADIVANVVQVGLIGLLILLPMPVGGKEPWVFPIAATVIALLFACWVLEGGLRGEFRVFKATYLLLPIGLLAVGLLQLFPNNRFVEMVGSPNAERWEMARAAGLTDMASRISLAPDNTVSALAWIGLMTIAGFLMVNAFRGRAGVLRLTIGLIAMAGIQAMAGFWPLMVDSRSQYSQGGIDGIVRGTFSNRNHFACMMGIGIILAVGLAIRAFRRPRPESSNPPTSLGRQGVKTPTIILLVSSLLIMGTAQILSQSRGGTATTAIGLCLLGVYAIRRFRLKWQGVAWGIGGLAVLLAAAGEGVARLSGRYGGLVTAGHIGMIGRVTIWKDTLKMAANHWVSGVGLGSFPVASTRYETGFVPDRISGHAHNDWLELVAEIGLPLGAVFISLTLALLVIGWRRVLNRRDPALKWTGIAAATSATVIALHALVEYNLHTPAVALATIGVVTVLALCCRVSSTDDAPSTDCWVLRIPLAIRAILPATVLVGAVMLATQCPRRVAAGRATSTLKLMSSPDHIERSRLKPEARSRFCVELCDAVLAVTPNDAYALRQKAEHETFLLQCDQINDKVSVTPEDVSLRLAEILRMMSSACRGLPTHGRYQALCAMAHEQSGRFGDGVDETKIATMYALAHENSPNLGSITVLCANAAWRRYLRSAAAAGDDDLQAKAAALALYRAAIRQSPERLEQILARVWRRIPSAEAMRELLPDLLIPHELLYQFLLKRGLFQDCATQLDVLHTLNQTRKTVADRDELSAYDMGRISKLSRDEVAASITKRRAFVWGMLGEWSKRSDLIEREREKLHMAVEPTLTQARELLNSGQSARAGLMLRDILKSTPGYDDAIVVYARHLRMIGKYRECAQTLATILYQPHAELTDMAVLNDALAITNEVQERYTPSKDAFPVHTFVRQGFRVLIGERRKDAAMLESAQATLSILSDELFAKRTGWMQEPMVHYYLGRCLEAQGKTPAAIGIYCRTVAAFDAHWYTYQRLLHLAEKDESAVPPTALDKARAIRDRLNLLPSVNTRFGDTIVLLGSACTPTRATRKDSIQIDHQFLCVGNVTKDYDLYVRFRTRGEHCFSSRLHPNSGMNNGTLGWRVGELALLSHTLNPAMEATRTATALQTGLYDMEISLVLPGKARPAVIPTIPARLPAFEWENVNGE